MKKIFLVLACAISVMASAQVLNVTSVEKVAVPQNSDSKVAGISPDGTYLLLTSQSNRGLQKFDLATGQLTAITDANGAGYNVSVSADGNEILYRETSLSRDRSRLNSLKKFNLSSSKSSTLLRPTDNFTRVQVKAKSKDAPVVSIENRQLMLTVNGDTKVLSPNGQDCSYIWPSVSPDGQKVLYYIAGNGAWVANIDGSNPVRIGTIRAPKWYSNSVIIGMQDKDNGEVVTESAVVAYSLEGEFQRLTGCDIMAMYPYSSLDGSKIVCSTPAGEAYLININVK